MALFAIGDLHLSFASEKPMDVFGPQWENHAAQIETAWTRQVTHDDIVLIPGDISWAMQLKDAIADLDFIGALPGRKILIRGNHDFWWHSIGKVRSALHGSMVALQNDAVALDGVAFCGTRGWVLPSHPKFSEEDERIYHREVERLRLSLEAAKKMQLPIVAMLHYPPCSSMEESTPYTDLMEAYGVSLCVYGHLHGHAHRFRVEGVKNGVSYRLVSADYLAFSPQLMSF